MSNQNITHWDDGSGDVVADFKAAIKKIQTETPKLPLVCVIECSPFDARAICKVAETTKMPITLMSLSGIHIIENVSLLPGFALGRDANNNVIGWLDGKGWHRPPLPEWIKELIDG